MLGSIGEKGTALIIANDETLYAYSMGDDQHPPWDKMIYKAAKIIQLYENMETSRAIPRQIHLVHIQKGMDVKFEARDQSGPAATASGVGGEEYELTERLVYSREC